MACINLFVILVSNSPTLIWMHSGDREMVKIRHKTAESHYDLIFCRLQ